MNPPEDLIDDLQLLEPPEPFRIQWWMIAIAAAVILGFLLFRRHRKKTRLIRLQAATLKRAYVDALAELEKLFGLIEKEESRPYALESSAIIRTYIETRFELQAPVQSTEEFLAGAQQSPKLEKRHRASLAEFLRICDLLKFARTLANRAELSDLHTAAVNFVKETRHVPAPLAA